MLRRDPGADRLIGTVRRVLTEEGPGPLAFRAAQLLLRDPWGHTEWFDVFETPTEDDDGRPVERPVWAAPADASDLAGLSGSGIAAVRERFAAGMRCAGYGDDGVVHAMLWLQAGVRRWDANGVVASFPGHGSIWATDGYGHPARRGESLALPAVPGRQARPARGGVRAGLLDGGRPERPEPAVRREALGPAARPRAPARLGAWHLARLRSERGARRWVLTRGPVEVPVGSFTRRHAVA